MKKRVLSVFLLSLVLPIIASSNKDSISEYTYIAELHGDIFKVRFNADKTLDFFSDGEWKHVDSVVLDTENLNFIVHKSNNPEFFQLLDWDNCEMGLGVLSEDRKTLYMAAAGEEIIFSREETKANLKFATNYTYVSELDPSFKVQFNADNSLDIFSDGERNTLPVTWLDKKKRTFIGHPDPKEDLDLVGVFSEDEKKLYFGLVACSLELSNPKLTLDSINVGGITLHSTPEDLLIQYPAARVIHKDNQTEFLVDGLDGFAEVRFTFKNDKLVHILKYEPELLGLDRDEKVSALVQKSVRELTEKYGKPKINQPAFGGGRIFNWYGEVVIELGYYFSSVDEYGHRMREYCSINYDFDSCDSGL